MSDLILPKHYVNQSLENNLAVFFARYPHEKARLEPILRKEAKSFSLVDLQVPAAPSKPPIRIILLAGIGNPQFLAKLLNDRYVQEENLKVFIFEQDPEFLAWCFQNFDLTEIISSIKTEWFFCMNRESVKPALFMALRPESVTSVARNVQLLQLDIPVSAEAKAFYSVLPQIYDETLFHIFHNHGNLNDSLLGLRLTVENKENILSCPGITDLKGVYKGQTALLIGAGPSLDHNLETIKKYNDRFVVIAADAALKPLTKAGIRVDYVTSIERCNKYQVPFFTDMEKTNAELVAFPVVYPEIFTIYPGPIRLVYRNYSYYAYFEKAWPKTMLRCGGSTSHLGLRLADHLGCSKIIFVGLDSCYEKNEAGLFRSHCKDTGYPAWGEFTTLEELHKRKHAPPFAAVNNAGEDVLTNITYYQWIKEYSEELAWLGDHIKFINASRGGMKIEGIPYQPLEEIAQSLDPIIIEKPTRPAPVMTRTWEHKAIRQNLEKWDQLCDDVIKECDELTAMSEIDVNRFHTLVYIYNFRVINDTMFIAFIVQCAAHDFFDIENEWWYLDIRVNKDLKEKTAVMRKRFELFKKALQPLLEMFKKEEGEVDESNGSTASAS